MNRRLARLALALAFVALAAACGGKDKVGDQNVLNFDPQGQGGRLGATTIESTTTTLIPPDATATTDAPIGQPEATTTTTAPPAQQEVSVEIVMSDNSPYFTPSLVQVPVGGKVRFRNNGTAPHEVRGDQNEFDLGPIAPGDVAIYTATVSADINYHDPNRPFAGGEVQVV
jgi:plastocyanin